MKKPMRVTRQSKKRVRQRRPHRAIVRMFLSNPRVVVVERVPVRRRRRRRAVRVGGSAAPGNAIFQSSTMTTTKLHPSRPSARLLNRSVPRVNVGGGQGGAVRRRKTIKNPLELSSTKLRDPDLYPEPELPPELPPERPPKLKLLSRTRMAASWSRANRMDYEARERRAESRTTLPRQVAKDKKREKKKKVWGFNPYTQNSEVEVEVGGQVANQVFGCEEVTQQ